MDIEKIKILIIEDDFSLNELIRIKLTKQGYETHSIYTGKEAIDFIPLHPEYFVLLDFKLSDMYSERVINELHARKIIFPFVVMTGFGDQRIAVEMMKLGAYDYIVKDLGFVEQLPAILNKATSYYLSQRKLEESQNIIAKSEEQFRSIFENIHDIYLVLSADFKIELISPSVFELFNVEKSALIGKNISELFVLRNEWLHCYNAMQDRNFIKNVEVLLSYNPERYLKNCLFDAKRIFSKAEQRYIIIGTIRDITEYKKLENELITKVIQTEENERKLIAEELHDDFGPLLSTVKIYINMLMNNKETLKDMEILTDISNIIDESVKNIRNIVNSLTPNTLLDYGLEKAFQAFINKLISHKEIEVNFSCNLKQERFGQVLESTIYRSGIEMINNGLKHSMAKNIQLQLEQIGENLWLRYFDNGIGFDAEVQQKPEISKGHGMINIINRVKSLHGKIEIKSSPEKGTSISILFILSNILDV